MNRIEIGVVGAGWIAENVHLPVLASFPDVKVVAICDVREERAREMAERFSIPAVHTDHQRLLSSARLDAVFVLTSVTATGGVGVDCLSAGVPSLLEKPPGQSVSETRALLAAARAGGARAMVGFNRRFQPMIQEGKRLVEAEGPLVSVLVEFHTYDLDYWRLRFPEEIVGNFHVAQSIHAADLIRFIGGDVAEVYGGARRHFDRQSDALSALIRFRSGASGHLICNYTSTTRIERAALHGKGIVVHLEGTAPGTRSGQALAIRQARVWRGDFCYDIGGYREEPPQYALHYAGFAIEDRYFVDCVKEGRDPAPPAGTLEEAVKSMELVDTLIHGGWGAELAGAPVGGSR